jgi:hypothetical protein
LGIYREYFDIDIFVHWRTAYWLAVGGNIHRGRGDVSQKKIHRGDRVVHGGPVQPAELIFHSLFLSCFLAADLCHVYQA